MTGINQGRPEVAIGEPIRLGSNNEFEIEQHPVSDRLIIRDTVNGKVAYVRKERGGQIGGDGVLVKALKEGKPVADDGRAHDTIQQAERAASGWVFVPPGTFNESVTIDTEGLTLRGSGYNTLIDSGDSISISIVSDNVVCKNVRTLSTSSVAGIKVNGRNNTIQSVRATANDYAIRASFSGVSKNIYNNVSVTDARGGMILNVGEQNIVSNCNINQVNVGVRGGKNDLIINNIIYNTTADSIRVDENCVVGGNRLINAGDNGIQIYKRNNLIFNNRVSDSTNADINDFGTGTILDGNLTGASN